MRVLITGHRGFVGSYVYTHLLKRGFDVSGCDWPDDLRYAQAFENLDAVVHLAAVGGVSRAARNPRFVMSNNVDGTMALRAALRTNEAGQLPQVIQISSFSVYGDQPVPWDESTPPAPKEIYAASKLAQELCWAGYGGPVARLRLSSVYGPGMRLRLDDPEATVVAKIAKAARDGQVFDIYEDGLQERDFVHVEDVAGCIAGVLLLRPCPADLLVTVCSGEKTTILDACHLLGAKYTILNRPRSEGDMRSCWGLTDRMRELIGRDPMSFQKYHEDIWLLPPGA